MDKTTTFVGQHIFAQVLTLSSKNSLSPIIKKAKGDRYYKSIKSWDHFVSMMFAVLSGCTSLREICISMEAMDGKLNHLGIEKAPARSTLSDANKNRSSAIFGQIYQSLYERYKLDLSDSTLPVSVREKLFIIDSTVFSLFKAVLRTSGKHAADGKKKGGIKKNTMLKASSLMPVLVQFNAAADNDQQFLKFIELPEGSYLTFDKGYNNYQQYARFTKVKIYFISRQKDNAVYKSVSEKLLNADTPNSVLKDEVIELTYKDEAKKKQVLQLRRIAWWDNEEKRVYEFITNNFELEAKTIADIYQYRWQIELFFKKLKQNCPLAYFVGDNQNAIEIQIWCSLIAILLVTVIHSSNKSKMAFSNLMTLIRIHLTNQISLKELIALHNKKRVRGKKPQKQQVLFAENKPPSF
jgi:hypothetical protein